jgi:hypothetical protein
VAVLVVELAGQEIADLALGDVRQSGRDQLHRAKLVVHALPHTRAELRQADSWSRLGILPHVAPAPERCVVGGEASHELARIGRGQLAISA